MVNAHVHSFLENGLMLSFLTYFSGTVSYFSQTRLIFLALQECLYFISVCSFYCQVDIFNLLNSFPSGNWKDDYSKNKKVFTIFLFFVDNCCVCAWHLHFCNISYCVLFFFYNIGYLEWFSESFHYNLQVNARILFVDPSTRAVGLTLNKHLLHLEVPPIVSCLFCHDNQFDVFLYVYLYASDVGLSRK